MFGAYKTNKFTLTAMVPQLHTIQLREGLGSDNKPLFIRIAKNCPWGTGAM